MRCPRCNYQATQQQQQESPGQCPECRVFYEKFIKHAAGLKAPKPSTVPTISPLVKDLMRGMEGSQPVVLIDINIPFSALVTFFLKVSFAMIPALIIMGLISSVVLLLSGAR